MDMQKAETALRNALAMMEAHEQLEPTSALKQAASDQGIPEGEPMGEFVRWANEELFGDTDLMGLHHGRNQ